ncbi:hypothetical protein [Chitinophaga vietnamensis]|uniref:hypothetical protein n=1 Tax=Chitinophaga vietnamensis TaxID=2593957 RepID=UPI001177B93E|nr:hypothetical protein [Chitinophaga vietnamensis]
MEKDTFNLIKAYKEIENKFTKDGWIDICRPPGDLDDSLYCCLVKPEALKDYLKSHQWGIHKGEEGRPCIIGQYEEGEWKSIYQSFSEKDFEPFLYYKYFTHIDERYIDVSEEFVNYFQLYEKGSKNDRTFIFFNEIGDTEEVLVITGTNVRIKKKFLMEYISIRQLHFSICFEYMVMATGTPSDYDAKYQDKDYVSNDANYNHLIRYIPYLDNKNLQSWILGKIIIPFDPKKSGKTWYDKNTDHETFIIGYDEDGEEKAVPCDSEEHKFFTPVYFKKEVLQKYYSNPEKYTVDGFSLTSKALSLKIDNNNNDYVVVFLNDLRMLPQKEQLHWKHYNIPPSPEMGISGSYYDTMIMGNWARKSDAIDVRFKQEYSEFNKKWVKKFGWEFYKTPVGADLLHFEALHLPANESVSEFCDQMLNVVKFTIDSLNEGMLTKELEKVENEKGISKLERFLRSKGVVHPDILEFLRHLQNLRSGMIAHRFSNANKSCQKAIEYFKITGSNYREVGADILLKSLFTINTLSVEFLE